MSLDRSLKSANALVRHRNVLTRPEKLAKLKDEEKWDDSKSVYRLPKVAHRKQELAKAEKTDSDESVLSSNGFRPTMKSPLLGSARPSMRL